MAYWQKGNYIVQGNVAPDASYSYVNPSSRPDLYNSGTQGTNAPVQTQPASNYQAPQINNQGILATITGGNFDPNQASSYIASQVKNSYLGGTWSADAQNAYAANSQKDIQAIYDQLQGKSVNFGTQSYQFGSGGQASKTSTTMNQSTTTNQGTKTSQSGYTGNSIVDYLNSVGQNSSYSSRAILAQKAGISGYSGTAEQNTQLLNMLKSQSGTSTQTSGTNTYKYVDTAGNVQTVQASTPEQAIAQAPNRMSNSGVQLVTQPTTSSIGNPVQSPTSGATSTMPTLPAGQAGSTTNNYMGSLSSQISQAQINLQAEADKRSNDYQKQIDDLNNQLSEQQTLQDQGLQGANQATIEATNQKKAALELERQRFDENYNANQALIGEMNGLLTEGNQVIKQMQETTGLSSIMQPRIAQTMSDVAARAGVIQAVISARNGQMNQAQSQLGTTFDAISSILGDQMNYYKTVMDFYQTRKNETNNKLLNLTNQQKDYLDVKLNLLSQQLTNLEATKQIISKAMLDPATASIYGNAGVTMNDSPEQIARKIATYSYSQELKDMSNKMSTEGYTQVPIAGVTPTKITDSAGNVKNWYAKPGTAASKKVSGTTGATSGYYTEKTTPTNLKNEIIANIAGGATASQIYSAYSDVDSAYLEKLLSKIEVTASAETTPTETTSSGIWDWVKKAYNYVIG